MRRLANGRISVFSGVEWAVDSSRGLNGYCDFILTRGSSEHVLRAPFLAVVEAKNDLIRTGLGQCIAAMYAAQLYNQQEQVRVPAVYGAVSTGSAWKFLHLKGSLLAIDVPEYYIDNLPKIMGILKQ